MMKEVKCVGYRRKGMNTVFIPESIARGKMCPACEEGEKRINVAHPSKEKAQLNRNWWDEEREAKRRE